MLEPKGQQMHLWETVQQHVNTQRMLYMLCAPAYFLALPLGQYRLWVLSERRQAQQHSGVARVALVLLTGATYIH